MTSLIITAVSSCESRDAHNLLAVLRQTDASINSGSSGGALLDSSGRLIGLSTATYTRKKQVHALGIEHL